MQPYPKINTWASLIRSIDDRRWIDALIAALNWISVWFSVVHLFTDDSLCRKETVGLAGAMDKSTLLTMQHADDVVVYCAEQCGWGPVQPYGMNNVASVAK